MNQYNFYPGQKVVCVDAEKSSGGRSEPLIEGATYHVDAIRIGCGCWPVVVSVGLLSHTGITKCSICKTVWPGRWHRSTRFVPHEPLKEVIDRIEKEGSPVELETVEA